VNVEWNVHDELGSSDRRSSDLAFKRNESRIAPMLLRSLTRGALLRCPVCGEGKLFSGYNHVVDRCASCGADFHASAGEWTGALMFAQGVFGMIALGGWYVLFLFGLPVFALPGIAWLVGWGLVAPLLFYPSFKGAWIGAMHAAGGLGAPGELTRP